MLSFSIRLIYWSFFDYLLIGQDSQTLFEAPLAKMPEAQRIFISAGNGEGFLPSSVPKGVEALTRMIRDKRFVLLACFTNRVYGNREEHPDRRYGALSSQAWRLDFDDGPAPGYSRDFSDEPDLMQQIPGVLP